MCDNYSQAGPHHVPSPTHPWGHVEMQPDVTNMLSDMHPTISVAYNFDCRPGQYAHLNVPQISWAEWHPFTITSVPSDEFIMFHIKSAGDWTALLHDCISRQLVRHTL